MVREEIEKLTEKAVKDLYGKEVAVSIERPSESVYGDYATNIAMTIKKNPQEIANIIKSTILEKIEVKNGFINFFVSKEYLQKQVGEILRQKESFGKLKTGKGQKINVEFISANPTGPLTLGNGRGGFCGDVLANILDKAGYKTEREYYINDVGEQIKKLGHSVLQDNEMVYTGWHIGFLNSLLNKESRGGFFHLYDLDLKDIKDQKKVKDPQWVGEFAGRHILEEMIKPSVKKMGIVFDVWFSEKKLHEKKEVNKVLEFLKKKNLAYMQEGALWFKSTQFGDDKDRVLVKENSETTYLASDIAYLKDKFKRGFNKLIFFWGADHYGYINRLKAAAVALGYKKEQLDIIIMQLVRLIEAGKEVRMSKRTGIYVTIDELINEVGLDATRFFFLGRGADTHLNFDLDLAKQQSEKNPVFYVQYAHARICSILRKIDTKYKIQNTKYNLLNHPSELELIKQLVRLPEIVEDTAEDYQVQRLPQYALDVATVFHQFYRDCKVLRSSSEPQSNSEAEGLREARLSLVSATGIMLKNILNLMGISAPEKM